MKNLTILTVLVSGLLVSTGLLSEVPEACSEIFAKKDPEAAEMRQRTEQVANMLAQSTSLSETLADINRQNEATTATDPGKYVAVYNLTGQTLAHGVPGNIGVFRLSHPAVGSIISFAQTKGEGPVCYRHETCPIHGLKIAYVAPVKVHDGTTLVVAAAHCLSPK